ncbi:MAG: adenosylcobinamide-GDP ribazoletransferase [Magnetococcales bacterium]|nr:adenosylcobinamide-GDP ribazoletransferase [Magnetococcales bacterium]
MTPLVLAFSLLTKIPMPMVANPPAREVGISTLYYPLVGVVIGLVLSGMAWGMDGLSLPLHSVLVLIFWVWLTGGLHLDGLADSADGWIGGMGSREKTLAIMKDPQSGPGAVVVVVLLLLLKVAALHALLAQGRGGELLWLVPLFGRFSMVFLLLTLPYVRQQGMGAVVAAHLPARGGWMVLTFWAALSIWWWPGGVVAWGLGLGFLLHFRKKVKQRLGGITGDLLGAGCELSEAVFLLFLCFFNTP